MNEQPFHNFSETISKNRWTEWGINSKEAISITNLVAFFVSTSEAGSFGGKSNSISTLYGPGPNLDAKESYVHRFK